EEAAGVVAAAGRVDSEQVDGSDVARRNERVPLPVDERPGVGPLRVIPEGPALERRSIDESVSEALGLLPNALVREVEEELLLDDRPAHGRAELVADERRFRQALAVAEERVRIERLVPVEVEHAAVELIRPRAIEQLPLRSRAAAVLRLGARRDAPVFGDRLDRNRSGRRGGAGAETRLGRAD